MRFRMNIYIDESGTFVSPAPPESWSVVVAVTAPEASRRLLRKAVERVRHSAGAAPNQEVKLSALSDEQYLDFLFSIGEVELALFAVATDAGFNTPDIVKEHQRIQVEDIRSNIPRMVFEGGRRGVELLANQLEALPTQLYVQLICQVDLLHAVLFRAINYFAQRVPVTLRAFRWRIDQKNTTKTKFEEAFEKIAPPLLQARSIREPMMWVRGFDYSHFKPFEFLEGEFPAYLQTDHGLPPMEGFNVQKLFREDLRFQDSRNSDGIQVADLLASGIRRLLKNKFADPARVAQAIGKLTIENIRGELPIDLVVLTKERQASPHVAEVMRAIRQSCRPLLTRESVDKGNALSAAKRRGRTGRGFESHQ